MDAIKCFDKLWLQACVNSLYEAGIDNDLLNLFYIENKHAQIAVKNKTTNCPQEQGSSGE